jgi:hypothetical protein
MKTIKEMKIEIAEKYAAIPEKQVSTGVYLRSIGSKYITLINTWDGTHLVKMEISNFYHNYIS